MKKAILLLCSVLLFYMIFNKNSSLKEVDEGEPKEYKIKRSKTIKKRKSTKVQKNIIMENKKLINSMMIHFYKINKNIIKSKISIGDFNKLDKLITKIESKKELNQRDIFIYDYLKSKNIIKALKMNNIKFL
jgi:short subunit fatty acids transporter